MTIRDRIAGGIRIGLRVAVFFACISLVVFLVGGNEALAVKGNPPIERLLVVYLVGGLTAGAVGGALSPWATSDLRAAAFGAVALVPMGLTWRIMTDGFAPWTRGDTLTQLFAAIIIGGGWGVATRRAMRVDA